MDIKKSLENLSSIGFLFDKNFIATKERIKESPFLSQMQYFLSLCKDGIALEDNNRLPQIFIQKYEENFLQKQPDFHLQDPTNMVLSRLQGVAYESGLTVFENDNFLKLSEKGQLFVKSSDATQFIFLFEQYFSYHNIDAYDKYKSGKFVQAFALGFLNIIYFENGITLRGACRKAYEKYPILNQLIQSDITCQFGSNDKKETFYEIVEIRLLKRFFQLFNLINIENQLIKPSDLFIKMMPQITQEEITNTILSSKKLKELNENFSSLGYDVDLFSEFFIISGALANKEEIPFYIFKDFVFKRYRVKEEDEVAFINIHTEYYMSVGNFYNYLLDDEREGDVNQELIEYVYSTMTLLLHQLPKTLLPMVMYKNIEEALIPSLFSIFDSYGIMNNNPKTFLVNVKDSLGDLVYEKVEHFF